MALPTYPLTIDLFGPSGDPMAGVQISIRLTSPDVDLLYGQVSERTVRGLSDESGSVTIDLWPNTRGSAGSQYHVRGIDPQTGAAVLDAHVTMPEQACRLRDIVLLPPPSSKPYDEAAIEAIKTVRSEAVAAQLAVEAAQGSIALLSDSAADSELAASQAAIVAETARDAAAESEALAAAHVATAGEYATEASLARQAVEDINTAFEAQAGWLETKNTDDLTEGDVNQFYTSERVLADIGAYVNKAFIDELGVVSEAPTLDTVVNTGAETEGAISVGELTVTGNAFVEGEILSRSVTSATDNGEVFNAAAETADNGDLALAENTEDLGSVAPTSLSQEMAEYVDNALQGVEVDLTGYATESYVQNAVANAEPDLTGYATESYVQNSVGSIDLSPYATTTSVAELVETAVDAYAPPMATPRSLGLVFGKTLDNTTFNTAIGWDTQNNVTTGKANTSIGNISLQNATTASDNTAVGRSALRMTTNSVENTAVGLNAGYNVLDGSRNAAYGAYALFNLTTGSDNVAMGRNAGYNMVSATGNVVIGTNAFSTGQSSTLVTAIGTNALQNSTGEKNTAIGHGAGNTLTTGINNVLVGYGAQTYLPTNSHEIVFGNVDSRRLRVPGLSLDTEDAGQNNILAWNNTGGESGAGGFHWLDSADFVSAPATSTTYGMVQGYTSQNTGNTALGYSSLPAVTSGNNNIAIGRYSAQSLTTGSSNVAMGYNSGNKNVDGAENVAVGTAAMYSNVSGKQNTGIGHAALYQTTGNNNTGVGFRAGVANTSGVSNVFVGHNAGQHLTTGSNNTVVGTDTFYTNTAGTGNVVVGGAALNNSTGNNNIAIGQGAGDNVATGSNNILLGYNAETSGDVSNEIVLGNYDHNRLRIPGFSLDTDAATEGDVLTWKETGGYAGTGGFVWTKPAAGGTEYTLPTASTSVIGGVKVDGNTITINGSGTISAQSAPVPAATPTAVGSVYGYTPAVGDNTAVGRNVLAARTTGDRNTGMGVNTLDALTTGNNNTAIGNLSMTAAVGANDCTAVGRASLFKTTSGVENTAIGINTLFNNTTGSRNSAFGTYALFNGGSLNDSTAFGRNSLYALTSGDWNVAVGGNALYSLTTGGTNTAIGGQAGQNLTDGTKNTIIGYYAGNSFTSGMNVTLLGYDAQPSASTVNNEITLGDAFVGTLRCAATSITALSDARDKTDAATLEAGLGFVNKLNPVSFTWDARDGGKVGEKDTGFMAQELKAAQEQTGVEIPGLVYEANPERLEASYGKLIPVLVKAIQELSDKVAILEKAGSGE